MTLSPEHGSYSRLLDDEELEFVRSMYLEQVAEVLAAEPERQVDLYVLATIGVDPPNPMASPRVEGPTR